MTPDTILKVDFYEDDAIAIKVPEKVAMKVVETGVASGSSDSTVMKLIKLENGEELFAPDFINVGDTVMINIHTIEYHSRL